MRGQGFFELIPAGPLRADATVPTLTALDLELICAGLPGIDLEEWRAHTVWISKGARLLPHEYVMLRERECDRIPIGDPRLSPKLPAKCNQGCSYRCSAAR